MDASKLLGDDLVARELVANEGPLPLEILGADLAVGRSLVSNQTADPAEHAARRSMQQILGIPVPAYRRGLIGQHGRDGVEQDQKSNPLSQIQKPSGHFEGDD